MKSMDIRKSTKSDLADILQIYAYAREQMRINGNPSQWGSNRPAREVIIKDIEDGNSYVIEDHGKICGVFSFIIGVEPTYHIIENGVWENEDPYGTIHRIAGNGTGKGVLEACLKYCEQQIPNIRIDTHSDNLIMQHLLHKFGYVKCGTIYVEDESPRIAYQKKVM